MVIINGIECEVKDIVTSKPGKHGAAKTIIKGTDPISGKVIESVYRAGDVIEI